MRWRSRRKRSSSSRSFPDRAASRVPRRPRRCCASTPGSSRSSRSSSTQYTTNYQKSTAVETRLWHGVFDLVKAFAAAYGTALRAGYPRADQKRWRDLLPWILVRLVHYKGIDGKFRLFRYSQWIPAQWREFHELYEFARMRDWQREQLAYGAGMFSKAGMSVEQEYLKSLLLMRLDSGNFTPDQVEWVAKQIDALVRDADAGAAAGACREPVRRSHELAGIASPGAPARRGPPAVSRHGTDLRADRRADAVAPRARRRNAEARRSSAARAASAADASRLAVRPRRDRASRRAPLAMRPRARSAS